MLDVFFWASVHVYRWKTNSTTLVDINISYLLD